jgi:predicted nucleotidyltransferase
MQPPAYIQDLCQAFLEELTDALGEKLYAVYLFGAVAFPETEHTGDIDFQVVLREPPNEPERLLIEKLHQELAEGFPPFGDKMDGHYLLLEDAGGTAQPASQLAPYPVDDAWGLHRAHLRAGRCIALYGPDPRQIYPGASWEELAADLEEQLQYVAAHLEIYPAYCVLNLCRLMYSFENREVVISKAAAAEWAWDLFPQRRALIEAARKWYAQQASAQDEALMMSEIKGFYPGGWLIYN